MSKRKSSHFLVQFTYFQKEIEELVDNMNKILKPFKKSEKLTSQLSVSVSSPGGGLRSGLFASCCCCCPRHRTRDPSVNLLFSIQIWKMVKNLVTLPTHISDFSPDLECKYVGTPLPYLPHTSSHGLLVTGIGHIEWGTCLLRHAALTLIRAPVRPRGSNGRLFWVMRVSASSF